MLHAIIAGKPHRVSLFSENRDCEEARHGTYSRLDQLNNSAKDYVEEQMQEIKRSGLYKDKIGGYLDYEAIAKDYKKAHSTHV